MGTCSPLIRGGPLFAWLMLAAIGVPASAGDAPHRFGVRASLRPAATRTIARGAGLSAQASLVSSRSFIPVQQGADLALIGKLARLPLGCADDTIFVDGFDPGG